MPIPVFAGSCCISFQACLQVLLSNVLSVGFYKTKSAFGKRNKKVGHSVIPLVSPHILPLGLWVWGLLLVFVVVVYLLFEKEIALLKNNWLT